MRTRCKRANNATDMQYSYGGAAERKTIVALARANVDMGERWSDEACNKIAGDDKYSDAMPCAMLR